MDVARNLGVGTSLVTKWVRQYLEELRQSNTNAFPGKGHLTPSNEKVKQLEQEVKRLTMERDILKKAMAFFVVHPK
ncbi:MAG: transposase [Oligoflexia bacterium]|nr:transposase [Oligoflexia bacterium]